MYIDNEWGATIIDNVAVAVAVAPVGSPDLARWPDGPMAR